MAWPRAAGAQQPAMPVIDFVFEQVTDHPHACRSIPQGLDETGYVEGQNVAIEYHLLAEGIRSTADGGG